MREFLSIFWDTIRHLNRDSPNDIFLVHMNPKIYTKNTYLRDPSYN